MQRFAAAAGGDRDANPLTPQPTQIARRIGERAHRHELGGPLRDPYRRR